MSRAELLIKKMGGTKYDIFAEDTTIDPDTGADIVEYAKYKTILAWIQPTGSEGSVKGVVLNDNNAGDSVTAEYFMYTKDPLKNHDRVQYEGYWFEVRAFEPWKASFMKFFKNYLVKVDNADITSQKDNIQFF